MTITIEECRAFIADAIKSRECWLSVAERSWGELKKRHKVNGLWSTTPNSIKRRSEYPVWYSIFKIRQSLVLSRVGIPIGKDTTQDGNDNVGATAAICFERLAVNSARSFDFFDYLCSVRDDFLATDFGNGRGYYERDEVKQRVKQYIQPQKVPGSEDVVFVDGDGQIIESDDIMQDDEGYFIEFDETVDVENEKICLEAVPYKCWYIDPDIKRWSRCKRIAFEYYYSEREFVQIFGASALRELPKEETGGGADEAYPKKQKIKVYEYWDEYDKEVKWFGEFSPDFIKPKGYMMPEDSEEYGDKYTNGLYDLDKFFPCTKPLMRNQSTDEFWPVPEFQQLFGIFKDIHRIFSRMVTLTKAIRPRLLFDNSITELQEALSEANTADAIGVTNLAQSLVTTGGTLDSVVQYIPVRDMIEGLNQLYIGLEQRLSTVYKLSGVSDMLQGMANDQTQRTLGERQMLEKYALNQHEEPQRKMAEFVRDSYQLMCEMALKNFKEASLDTYIMPQTLEPEHRQRYKAALGLLKDNTKRFRIELETDSTIALNEEYDKQMRMELVNALTSALEKTAAIAESNPALVATELHCLKYLVQGFRQGKQFQNEITEAIDNVIKQSQEPKPEPFDKDAANFEIQKQELIIKQGDQQLKVQEIEATNALKQYQIQSAENMKVQQIYADERMQVEKIQSGMAEEFAKLQQAGNLAQIKNSLEEFKLQSANAETQTEVQLKYAQLQSEIALAQQDLATKRAEVEATIASLANQDQVEQIRLILDQRIAESELQLASANQQLETYRVQMDEQEKYATEARLQSEHKLQQLESAVNIEKQKREMMGLMPQPAPKPEKPTVLKKKLNFVRDSKGNVKTLEFEGQQIAQVLRDELGNIQGVDYTSGT